jgi:hypothetical protein
MSRSNTLRTIYAKHVPPGDNLKFGASYQPFKVLQKSFCTNDYVLAGFPVCFNFETQNMLIKSLLELLEFLLGQTKLEKRSQRKRKAVWVKDYLKTRQTLGATTGIMRELSLIYPAEFANYTRM